jgi:hypothetical protein
MSANAEMSVAANSQPFALQSARQEYSFSPRQISLGTFGLFFMMTTL